MALFLAFVLGAGATHPPAASLAVGTARVPLAISSWCWRSRCGAPIAAAKRTAVVRRGTVVRLELRFVPRRVTLAVAGRPVAVHVVGREATWTATSGGGLTFHVTAAAGWVTYVGRLRLR